MISSSSSSSSVARALDFFFTDFFSLLRIAGESSSSSSVVAAAVAEDGRFGVAVAPFCFDGLCALFVFDCGARCARLSFEGVFDIVELVVRCEDGQRYGVFERELEAVSTVR